MKGKKMNTIIDRMAALQLEEKRPIFPVIELSEIEPWKIAQGKRSCQEIEAVNERITALYKGLGDRSADIAFSLAQLEEIAVQIAPSKRAFKAFAKRMVADKEFLIPMLMKASVTYVLAHRRLTYLHSIVKEKPYKKTVAWAATKAFDCQTADRATVATLWEHIQGRFEQKRIQYASYESAPFKNMISALHLEVARFAHQAACELESTVLAASIESYIKANMIGGMKAAVGDQASSQEEAPVWGAPFNPFWLGRVYNWYLYPEATALSNKLQLIAGRNDVLKSDIEQLLSTVCAQGLAPTDRKSFIEQCQKFEQRLRKSSDDFVNENESLYAGPRNALVVAAANYAAGLKEAIYDTKQSLELLQQFTTDQSFQFLAAFNLCMQLFSPNTESSLQKLQKLFLLGEELQKVTCNSGRHKITTFIQHTIQAMKDSVSTKGRQLIGRQPEEKAAWNALMLGQPLEGSEKGLPEVVRTLMLKLLFEHTYFSADRVSWELRALLFALDKYEHYKDSWKESETLHPDFIKAVLPHKSDWPILEVLHALFFHICKAEVARDHTSYAIAWKLLCDVANTSYLGMYELLQIARSKLIDIQNIHKYLYMPPSVTFELRDGKVVTRSLFDFRQEHLVTLKTDEKQALVSRALAHCLYDDDDEESEDIATMGRYKYAQKLVSQIIENPRFQEFFDARGDNRDMIYQNTANKLDSRNFEIALPDELKPSRKRKKQVQSFSKVQNPSLGIGLNEATLLLDGPLKPFLSGITSISVKDIDKVFWMYYIVEYEKEQEKKGFTDALKALYKEEGYTKWFTACERALGRPKELSSGEDSEASLELDGGS